jgi:hypothetical protein
MSVNLDSVPWTLVPADLRKNLCDFSLVDKRPLDHGASAFCRSTMVIEGGRLLGKGLHFLRAHEPALREEVDLDAVWS